MQSVFTSFFTELKEQIKISSEKALNDFAKNQNYEQIINSLKETVAELKNELKTLIMMKVGWKETAKKRQTLTSAFFQYPFFQLSMCRLLPKFISIVGRLTPLPTFASQYIHRFPCR